MFEDVDHSVDRIALADPSRVEVHAGARETDRAGAGIELRAARQVPAAASALGVATARRRLGAFVASAAIGGLAGGLAVQLAGVADAGEYGPYLSFRLLVAVLIGGVASAFGPAAGVAVGPRIRAPRVP